MIPEPVKTLTKKKIADLEASIAGTIEEEANAIRHIDELQKRREGCIQEKNELSKYLEENR